MSDDYGLLNPKAERNRESEYARQADDFYHGYSQLPNGIRARLSLYDLHQIFEHMVKPILRKQRTDL